MCYTCGLFRSFEIKLAAADETNAQHWSVPLSCAKFTVKAI